MGVAVTPDGKKVYITNYGIGYADHNKDVAGNDTISVIDTATNNVTATVSGFDFPYGVAVTPDGKKVYVTSGGGYNASSTVSVIETSNNTVTATVDGVYFPFGVAVSPDGKKVYVVNNQADSVSVIDTATNTITANVDVSESEGLGDPTGIAITPDGKKVYVTKSSLKNAAVIDTATNTVIGTVTVENYPSTFGKFIGGNIQKNKLNGSKAKASLSKHKQKNHSKHHKAEKKSPTVK